MADDKTKQTAQVEATSTPLSDDERTLADRKQTEKDLASGKVERFFYPEHGVSIIAKDRKEADNLLEKQVKEQSND